ncbi:4'-phosphopantetheinyl transferase family protein [Streptomyces sp. NPDC060194]|uniref:4'-phosphopantetheinyl transferase family protein n=1 Tax=Streptomyces sp. NPDC060194 TaxID=3347069 RepID=UPI00364D9789
MTGRPDDGTALAAVAATAEVLDDPELTEDLLAPWELRRLARVRRPADRDDVLAARLLLRLLLARYTGRPPGTHALVQFCPGCRRFGHGRPSLPRRPGTGVSMSHTAGLVAAAVGPGPLGVDVEPAGRRPGPAVRRVLPEAEVRAAELLPDPERALLAAWVRREARVKADRSGGVLREWTDGPRAAVAAVVAGVPVQVLADAGLGGVGRPRAGGAQPRARR